MWARMARELKAIDISSTPDLLTLAEEVQASEAPYLLRRDGGDIAMLVPALPASKRRGTRSKSEADMAVFWSSFGGWKDMDTDKLISDIYESRRISIRPPVEL
jgi:hypothetical protein